MGTRAAIRSAFIFGSGIGIESWQALSLLMQARRALKCVCLQNAAELVGKKIAELCLQKSIQKVAFDRGGFEYHGRVQVIPGLTAAWVSIG